LQTKKLINCKGKLISVEKPVVMGILNITPDSFFDGGKFNSIDSALFQTEKMLSDGATFIDIGGHSTRPRANEVELNVELNRTIPVIENILKKFPDAIISIDTFRSKVADEAIAAGAAIINDVSAGDADEHMFETVVKYNVPYILMHKNGSFKTMQQKPTYKDVVLDIINYFIPKVTFLQSIGVSDLILDPGFGFGKTLEHNFELLNRLEGFKIFELPLLIGVSRKKMIQQTTNTDASTSLNGTTAAHMIALMKGANILRVHDVKEAVECVNIYNQLKPFNS